MLTARISLEYRFQILSLALAFFFFTEVKEPANVNISPSCVQLWHTKIPVDLSDPYYTWYQQPFQQLFFFLSFLFFFSFHFNSLFFLEKDIPRCKTFSSVSGYLSSLHLLIKNALFSFYLHLNCAIRFKYIYC